MILFESNCGSHCSFLLLFDVVLRFVVFVWQLTLSSFLFSAHVAFFLSNFHKRTARLPLIQVGVVGHNFEGSLPLGLTVMAVSHRARQHC